MRTTEAIFTHLVILLVVQLNQFAYADGANDAYSDCTADNQVAIAIPMPSSECNGGIPVVVCKIEATCRNVPQDRPDEAGKSLGWACAGSMVNGVPTCGQTAAQCVNDTSVRSYRTDQLQLDNRNSSPVIGKQKFRWRMPGRLDKLMQPETYWQYMIQFQKGVAQCQDHPAPQILICHGTVDSTGFFARTEHPYCAGDRFGCPTADDCMDLYHRAVSNSNSRTAFVLEPLPAGMKTEPPPAVVDLPQAALLPIPGWYYFILALNFALSWWNARTCGRAWVESKAVGGWVRVMVWCGAIQSAIGFSSVFLLPLVFASHALFPDILTGTYVNGALSLWYLTIIVPLLGTGISITTESWIRAYRDRNLANLGVAAFNTLVQVHNVMGSIGTLQAAAKAVIDLFISVGKGKGDAKGKAMTLVLMATILVVLTALLAGGILTAVLIHYYAGTVPIQQHVSQTNNSST